MKLRLALRWPAAVAHKRALFCGARPSKGGARTKDGFHRWEHRSFPLPGVPPIVLVVCKGLELETR
jgi:hypothetical protein